MSLHCAPVLVSELAMHFQPLHSSSLLLSAVPTPNESLIAQSLKLATHFIVKIFCSEQSEDAMLSILLSHASLGASEEILSNT